jgi:hypothetical protein
MFCHESFKNSKSFQKLFLGIPIEYPGIFIPWNINEIDFIELFQKHNVHKVMEKGYFVKDITFLSEKHCNMGVYFKNTLNKISFSRNDYNGLKDYIASFNNFQIALEKAFGKPNKQKSILSDFEDCEWEISDNIRIYHYVIDRFGLEEHLYIERN